MIVDKTQDNYAATSNTRGVARNLDMSYSAIFQNLKKDYPFLSLQDQPCARVTSH